MLGAAQAATGSAAPVVIKKRIGTQESAFSGKTKQGTTPLVVGIIFMAITLTLQSMRIRDIGWDPVCVIPAWIAIVIVDKLIAGKIPVWSLGQDHNGTVVGALVNLVLLLALMFWPSGDNENPTFGYAPQTPDRPPSRTSAGSVAADRIARATGANFGRRAF